MRVICSEDKGGLSHRLSFTQELAQSKTVTVKFEQPRSSWQSCDVHEGKSSSLALHKVQYERTHVATEPQQDSCTKPPSRAADSSGGRQGGTVDQPVTTRPYKRRKTESQSAIDVQTEALRALLRRINANQEPYFQGEWKTAGLQPRKLLKTEEVVIPFDAGTQLEKQVLRGSMSVLRGAGDPPCTAQQSKEAANASNAQQKAKHTPHCCNGALVSKQEQITQQNDVQDVNTSIDVNVATVERSSMDTVVAQLSEPWLPDRPARRCIHLEEGVREAVLGQDVAVQHTWGVDAYTRSNIVDALDCCMGQKQPTENEADYQYAKQTFINDCLLPAANLQGAMGWDIVSALQYIKSSLAPSKTSKSYVKSSKNTPTSTTAPTAAGSCAAPTAGGSSGGNSTEVKQSEQLVEGVEQVLGSCGIRADRLTGSSEGGMVGEVYDWAWRGGGGLTRGDNLWEGVSDVVKGFWVDMANMLDSTVHKVESVLVQTGKKSAKEVEQVVKTVKSFPAGKRMNYRLHPKGESVVVVNPNGLPAGTIVGSYVGELYNMMKWQEMLDTKPTKQDGNLHPYGWFAFHDTPISQRGGYNLTVIDSTRIGNVTSFMSHSCEPNCVLVHNNSKCSPQPRPKVAADNNTTNVKDSPNSSTVPQSTEPTAPAQEGAEAGQALGGKDDTGSNDKGQEGPSSVTQEQQGQKNPSEKAGEPGSVDKAGNIRNGGGEGVAEHGCAGASAGCLGSKLTLITSRHVAYGQEVTWDYDYVIECDKQFASSICLCGSEKCRGSFMHCNMSPPFYLILNEQQRFLERTSNLWRACTEPLTSTDIELLNKYNFGTLALNHTTHVGRTGNKGEDRVGNKGVKESTEQHPQSTLDTSMHDTDAKPMSCDDDGGNQGNSKGATKAATCTKNTDTPVEDGMDIDTHPLTTTPTPPLASPCSTTQYFLQSLLQQSTAFTHRVMSPSPSLPLSAPAPLPPPKPRPAPASAGRPPTTNSAFNTPQTLMHSARSDRPLWLAKFAATVLTFIESERTQLEEMLQDPNSQVLSIKNEVYTQQLAQQEAQTVLKFRVHSLISTLTRVHSFLDKQPPELTGHPPLVPLSEEQAVGYVWNDAASLAVRVKDAAAAVLNTQSLTRGTERSTHAGATMRVAALSAMLETPKPQTIGAARKLLEEMAAILRDPQHGQLPVSLMWLHDYVVMHAYTHNYAKHTKYCTITGPEGGGGGEGDGEGPGEASKAGGHKTKKSKHHKGSKKDKKDGAQAARKYPPNYCCAQLSCWYRLSATDPCSIHNNERKGCYLMPDLDTPPSCSAKYVQDRQQLIQHLQTSPQLPWTGGSWSFKNSKFIYGSPMLDVVLEQAGGVTNGPAAKRMKQMISIMSKAFT